MTVWLTFKKYFEMFQMGVRSQLFRRLHYSQSSSTTEKAGQCLLIREPHQSEGFREKKWLRDLNKKDISFNSILIFFPIVSN
jgi:hypothetical protein